MLQLAGYPYAQEEHRHAAGCGHQGHPSPRSPLGAVAPVQRSAVHDVLAGAGRPLDTALREEMESRLGADFTDVRIHDDSAARASAASVGARAYTSGSHVVIGDGGADKHTLAHELTHVIQQRQGPVAGTDNGAGLKVSDPSDRFEQEAEANATRVMSGEAPQVQRTGHAPEAGSRDHSSPVIQRAYPPALMRADSFEVAGTTDGDFRAHIDVDHRNPALAGLPAVLADVQISNVTISDSDRGDTQFGADQESHTTAWTLLRQALMNFSNRSAESLVRYIEYHLGRMGGLEMSTWTTPGAAGRWHEEFVATGALFAALNAGTARAPLVQWGHQLSNLLEGFVRTYQLSSIATYRRGTPRGHGEGTAMAALRQAERALEQGEYAENPQNDEMLARLRNSLLDAPGMPTAALPAQAMAVQHFSETFSVAFPTIDEYLKAKYDGDYRPDHDADYALILGEFDDSSGDVSSMGAPLDLGALETGFLVRSSVIPDGNRLVIGNIQVSESERPKTQFVTNQRSHTVAWGLITRRVTALSGRGLTDAVTLMGEFLNESRNHPPVNSGTEFLASWHSVREQLEERMAFLRTEPALSHHTWSAYVSDTMRACVSLHNADRLATTGGSATDLGAALGHGEGATFARLDRIQGGMSGPGDPDPIDTALALLDIDAMRTRLINRMTEGAGLGLRSRVAPSAQVRHAQYIQTYDHGDVGNDVRTVITRWAHLIVATYPNIGVSFDELREAADQEVREGFSAAELILLGIH
ncbi:DUF4157 domain-containing protein [Streptomyces sp. NPDC097981]|uniref:eCIS core domain-containing protein n=1 Tax=Streptomyces sp. NPDC097981 TaxID=3155428 RepID=UPI003320C427